MQENVFSALWQVVQLEVATLLMVSAEELLPESTLDYLGIDSLERVELSLILEKKFQIRLSQAQMNACHTLADITMLVTMPPIIVQEV